MERTTTLEAAPSSARAARRFIAMVLSEWKLPEIVETAELLVSELVTNTLLHARTDTEVLVRHTGGTVHIEVCDTSVVQPEARTHHRESQTGRGLELVELLADSWGVDLHHGHHGVEGKGVWFELSVEPPAPAERIADGARPSRRDARSSEVCLEGVPTVLYRASQEHHQGLTREFVLMTIDDSAVDHVPSRLVALSVKLSQRFAASSTLMMEQVQAAERRGDPSCDLYLEVASDLAAPLEAIVELLEEADRFCEQGGMLTMAATPEVRAFRRWCVEEVTAQLAGRPGTPWRGG
ncbi:MAG: ATP-binding protein [Actinomycetota bacterium]|nr:ATP-binding protein [Actinomycetota bacterium]